MLPGALGLKTKAFTSRSTPGSLERSDIVCGEASRCKSTKASCKNVDNPYPRIVRIGLLCFDAEAEPSIKILSFEAA